MSAIPNKVHWRRVSHHAHKIAHSHAHEMVVAMVPIILDLRVWLCLSCGAILLVLYVIEEVRGGGS